MKRKITPYRVLVCGIILFFAYTLANKLLNLISFELNIAKTGLFQPAHVKYVAYGALTFESFSIVGLLIKEKVGLLISLTMMVTFSLYIVILYLLNRYEVCGCGGVLNGLSFTTHFAINIGIITILTYLLKKNETN
jgi:hypothetical protein